MSVVGSLPTHIYWTCEIFLERYVWSESVRALVNNGERVWVLSLLESLQTDCLRLLHAVRGPACENILPLAAVYMGSQLVWGCNVWLVDWTQSDYLFWENILEVNSSDQCIYIQCNGFYGLLISPLFRQWKRQAGCPDLLTWGLNDKRCLVSPCYPLYLSLQEGSI